MGRAWQEMGLGEHASVASFARFVLHLLSLGAPPDLLRDAIRAMGDEVQHARLCFGVVKRFTGEVVGPGRLELSNVLDAGDTPRAILEGAIVEGCVGETIAARHAEVARDRAEDLTVRAVLARIAEDESRHADLSWHFVEWMLKAYPELAKAADACFARTLAAVVDERSEAAAVEETGVLLERYGHLLPSSKQQIADDLIRDVIRPRVAALFKRSS